MAMANDITYRLILCIVVLNTQYAGYDALECHSCLNVHDTSECHTTATCKANEKCFTEAIGVGNNTLFTLGCRTDAQCFSMQTNSPGLVGRQIADNTADDGSTSTNCEQCCSVDYCNRLLCSNAAQVITSADGQCKDDADYNCELISSTFNICSDLQHAKTVCRKWCGLCDLVDGAWSTWNAWSLCDSTCGLSHKIRLRYCTDPAPVSGGLDCVGENQQFQNCTVSHCPVHGGWTTWATWSSCSATCGVGLENRQRDCSNPPPGYNGNHCFGDSVDNKVCIKHSCTDGGWSVWSSWGACSTSCNGGLKSRTRSCNNPAPSLFGQTCSGNNVDYTACSTIVCPSEKVFFTVNTPSGHLLAGNVPEFSKIVINEGNGYNEATGEFVCRHPGIYQFFVSFVTTNGTTQCMIRKNRAIVVYALTASTNWKSASASTYVHLVPDDVIDLNCGGWQHVDHNASTMFSGALVAAD